MVEDKICNAFLAAMHSIFTPKIELAIRSINASSGRDVTSVMATSELGEHIWITAPLESVSERNKALHVLTTNDETRNKIPVEVSALSVPDTQSQTHHSSESVLNNIEGCPTSVVLCNLLQTIFSECN